MKLDDIKRVNDFDDSTCHIFWHDARPDYPRRSTQHRMEVSVAGALGHIENFMHPQAIITNYPEHEDDYFVKAINRKTKELMQTHIQLPKGATDTLEWITRLDAEALHNWHSATIDIVVQAPQKSSGSLVRLLKSLETARYDAFLPPRLTLELPHQLHPDVMAFLDDFEWPPVKYQSHLPYHQLTLHRRIPEKRLTDYESSTRFMESFYPYDTMDSHVLILSPQAELSPSYYHYLKYHLLEYRYSYNSPDLFGISLETPSSYLNGTESFQPPEKPSSPNDKDRSLPFLWQAPNTGATLIFADKWVELHSFLTQYFSASSNPTTKSFLSKRTKQVAETLPSWAEYLLDLMRTRGYYFLYPGSVSEGSAGTSLAVLHNELYQIPEEYLKPRSKPDSDPSKLPTSDDVLEENDFSYLKAHHRADEDALTIERPLARNLAAVLPPVPKSVQRPTDGNDAPDAMPPLDELPLLDYQGTPLSNEDLADRAQDFTIKYRISAGGCTEESAKDREVIHGNAEDLFCISDDKDSDQHDRKSAHHEPEELKKAVVPDEERDAPTPTHQTFRGTGVAAKVNAVTDAEGYAATAVAGFKEKLDGKKKYEDAVPVVNLKDTSLTDTERAELEAVRRRYGGVEIADDDEEVKGPKEGQKRAKPQDEKIANDAKNKKPSYKVETDDREGDRPAGAPGAGGGTKDRDAERRGGFKEAQHADTDSSKGEIKGNTEKPEKKIEEEKPSKVKQPPSAPDEAGARPQHTDEHPAEVSADAEAARKDTERTKQQGSEERSKDRGDDDRDISRLPEEARDSAIGGGGTAKKGRIGGWDVGGFDEGIVDERAAAAGKMDFARNRGLDKEGKKERPREESDTGKGKGKEPG